MPLFKLVQRRLQIACLGVLEPDADIGQVIAAVCSQEETADAAGERGSRFVTDDHEAPALDALALTQSPNPDLSGRLFCLPMMPSSTSWQTWRSRSRIGIEPFQYPGQVCNWPAPF